MIPFSSMLLASTALSGGGGGDLEIHYVGGKSIAFGPVAANQTVTLSGLTGGYASAPGPYDTVVVFYSQPTGDEGSFITSGYTAEGQFGDSNDDVSILAGVKAMGSSPDASVTVSMPSPAGGAQRVGIVHVHVFSGVDNTTPLDAAIVTNSGNNAPPNPPSITTVSDGAMIVACGGQGRDGTPAAFTNSELEDFIQTPSIGAVDGCRIGSGYVLAPTAGAFDPAAFGGGNLSTATPHVGITVALRPGFGTPLVPTFAVGPAITGTANVGETLTATYTPGRGGTATYQWHNNGVDISGATNATYVLQASDETDDISVTITLTNPYGDVEETSAEVGPVGALVGYRYYFVEVLTTGNGYIGCATIKLLSGGGADYALQSAGATASAIGYTPLGGWEVTRVNDGNDGTSSTSNGPAAGSGKGIQIDLGVVRAIATFGFRARHDGFGASESPRTLKLWRKINSGDAWIDTGLVWPHASGLAANQYVEITL